MLQMLSLSNKSLLISNDCIIFHFFSFVSCTKTWWDRAALPHYLLVQGEGKNICCKRTITVIFRTVIWFVNLRQQATSYTISNTLKSTSFGSKYIFYYVIFLKFPSAFQPVRESILFYAILLPSWIPHNSILQVMHKYDKIFVHNLMESIFCEIRITILF